MMHTAEIRAKCDHVQADCPQNFPCEQCDAGRRIVAEARCKTLESELPLQTAKGKS